jgi:hypothetical protein
MGRHKNIDSDAPDEGVQGENAEMTLPAEQSEKDGGNEQQEGAEPDNTGAVSSATSDEGKTAHHAEKKSVKNEGLKGKKLIVGSKTVEFNADGIAELDAADADRLLTIPGYTEVKKKE